MDSALHFYNLAEDYFSLVRVYCYMEDIQKVTECYGLVLLSHETLDGNNAEMIAPFAFGPQFYTVLHE